MTRIELKMVLENEDNDVDLTEEQKERLAFCLEQVAWWEEDFVLKIAEIPNMLPNDKETKNLNHIWNEGFQISFEVE
jgi:hypothetical protein